MKKTTHILSALAISAVVAFSTTSCNQPQASDTAAAPAGTETVSVAKGAIVYVDLPRLMAGYDMANDLGATVEAQAKEIQTEISRREDNLRKAAEKFQEKQQKGLMTSATAQVEYQKIQKQELEYQNYAKQKNDEMNEKLMVTQNQINDAINTFIKKYNEEKQYAMILLTQGDAEGDGVVTLGNPVLTADPALDITDDVLAGLNEEYVAAKNSK